MKPSTRRRASRPLAGFSVVELIGVLATCAILAVVVVPKAFSTLAAARVKDTAASVASLQSAVTDFAGKYGTLPAATDTARFDDLLVTAGLLEGRFAVKLGTQPANPSSAAAWSNATGAWVATAAGAVNQNTQSRLICLDSNANPPAAANGANYRLNGGVTNLPAGSRVVSAVICQVSLNDARELSLRLDGDAMTQPVDSALADAAGKVVYSAASGLRDVYIYLAHR